MRAATQSVFLAGASHVWMLLGRRGVRLVPPRAVLQIITTSWI